MVPYRPLMRIAAFVCCSVSLPLTLMAQLPEGGRELYEIGCAKCHGSDGRGVDPSLVGFVAPLPDFTDCRFSSREADDDWIAVTHLGGPARGFNSTMPAYAEAFDAERIERIVEYMREFCTDRAWPRGELNLPRPLVTEKAFLEDEVVWTTFVDVEGYGALETQLVYEGRIGARHQWEATLPIGAAPSSDGAPWSGGIGDVALGWKSAFWHSPSSIVTAGGEVFFPTGDEDRSLGKGTFLFEPYLAFAHAFPEDWFFQAQGGAEFPADTEKAEQELFWRGALGKSFSARGGFGRLWSPMIEVLGGSTVDFEETSWSLVPQMQVTLSTRQHIRVNAGVLIPVNRRDERPAQFVFYFLWDWFDGGLADGW